MVGFTQAQFAVLTRHLKKTALLPFLVFALLAFATGCGSDPDEPAATPASAVETAVAPPTATPPVARPLAGTETPDPTGQAGRNAGSALTPEPSPTAVVSTPGRTSTAEPPATPTARPADTLTPAATSIPAATATPTAEPAATPGVGLVSSSGVERNTAPTLGPQDLRTLAGGNNAFAFDLYGALAGSEGNLFFSPHSISTALAMAYAGARGETERQMADTLRFGLPQERLHPAVNALDLSLSARSEDDSGLRLNVANSVWGQEGYGFLPDFLDTLALNYGGEIRPVDFRQDSEGARVRINDWIAEETEDKIKDLIPPRAIGGLTRMVLANAIYFKAAWQYSFDEGATTDRPFHLLDGSQRDAPMMRQQEDLRYASGDGYQAVQLPYGRGDASMTILLPDSGGFREFEDSLNADSLEDILKGLDRQLVRLTMPKFKMESAFSLSGTLAAMGMPDAFDGSAADFSGMDGQRCGAGGGICLLISDVLHKAFVSVDENGTEAAAATAVLVGITSMPEEPEPIEMDIDRPFIFLIRDHTTGAILFLGRVLEP